jgi:hypothetical protein
MHEILRGRTSTLDCIDQDDPSCDDLPNPPRPPESRSKHGDLYRPALPRMASFSDGLGRGLIRAC